MKVAVLGAGGMGETVISHLKESPFVKEIIAVDKCPERVQKLNANGIKATLNLKATLDDKEVKIAFVTSSNDAHKELCMAAFEAGKAVMCEKPIATTLEDARQMIEAAEKRKLFFQIGFELRYSKLYTTVKNWIDQGLLGTPLTSNCTYFCSEFHGKGSWRNKLATGGSMFGEKLCHYVDIPRWWIGSEVLEVHSMCAPNVVPYYEVHDNYHTIYRFKNGAVASIIFLMYLGETFEKDPLQDDYIEQQKDDGHQLTLLVAGTKGAADCNVFHRRIRRWEFGDSPKCMTSKLVEIKKWEDKEDHSYFHNTHDQTLDIVRRVQHSLPPATPARDAYKTMLLSFAAEKSADLNKTVKLEELS
jgi:predicted dehydrogenase